MAKKQKSTRPSVTSSASDVPVVGLREPCPCGSGRRYKACHGRGLASVGETLVRRPFAGLSGDFFDLHMDDRFARSQGFPGRVAHGHHAPGVEVG